MNGIRLYSIRLGRVREGTFMNLRQFPLAHLVRPFLSLSFFFLLLLFDSFSPLVQLLQRFYLFGS